MIAADQLLLYLYQDAEVGIKVCYPEGALGQEQFTHLESLQHWVAKEAQDLGLERYLIMSLKQWGEALLECHHLDDLGQLLVRRAQRTALYFNQKLV